MKLNLSHIISIIRLDLTKKNEMQILFLQAVHIISQTRKLKEQPYAYSRVMPIDYWTVNHIA
jgi:hypothetical protein